MTPSPAQVRARHREHWRSPTHASRQPTGCSAALGTGSVAFGSGLSALAAVELMRHSQ